MIFFFSKCSRDICKHMRIKYAFSKLSEILLSNTTAKRTIYKMSNWVEETIISTLKQRNYFTLQLDESTDVVGQANLLAFVRFENNDSAE